MPAPTFEIHSCLDLLLYYLDQPGYLGAGASFVPRWTSRAIVVVDASSRAARELPEVLEQWQIGVRGAGLEIDRARKDDRRKAAGQGLSVTDH